MTLWKNYALLRALRSRNAPTIRTPLRLYPMVRNRINRIQDTDSATKRGERKRLHNLHRDRGDRWRQYGGHRQHGCYRIRASAATTSPPSGHPYSSPIRQLTQLATERPLYSPHRGSPLPACHRCLKNIFPLRLCSGQRSCPGSRFRRRCTRICFPKCKALSKG